MELISVAGPVIAWIAEQDPYGVMSECRFCDLLHNDGLKHSDNCVWIAAVNAMKIIDSTGIQFDRVETRG
jgi:hypothetical protein